LLPFNESAFAPLIQGGEAKLSAMFEAVYFQIFINEHVLIFSGYTDPLSD
jgi:hypothetical protein